MVDCSIECFKMLSKLIYVLVKRKGIRQKWYSRRTLRKLKWVRVIVNVCFLNKLLIPQIYIYPDSKIEL